MNRPAILAALSLAVALNAAELQVTPLAPPGSGVAWNALGPGYAYTVQRAESLGQNGVWLTPRTTAPWPAAGLNWTDPAPPGPAAFYRVIAVTQAQRGKLVSAGLTTTVSKFTIALIAGSQGVQLTPAFDVNVYKLNYETVDPLGSRTTASGALMLPVGDTNALPLASYQHGTMTAKAEAPSVATLSAEGFVGLAFASTGYAAALPDYLGLGDSPGSHPYLHASSEATAGVDMLRAARAFCTSNHISLNTQLFLCGYSQGGHATAALQRELEEYHTDEFTITASAPMAGPYDLSGVTADDFLAGHPEPNPYYFAYLLASFVQVYQLAPSLAALLTPPYDTTVPPLFDGQHTGDQINAAMPAVPIQVLKPEVLAAFQNDPRHPLRMALRDNDLYRWAPKAPTRLYQCSGDLDVPPANAHVAVSNFVAMGATQVQFNDPKPGADHGDCALPALLAAKTWFDSLKH
jgi:alpha/beta superfamily hydrolase